MIIFQILVLNKVKNKVMILLIKYKVINKNKIGEKVLIINY